MVDLEDGSDPSQRDLIKQLQEKLLVYGESGIRMLPQRQRFKTLITRLDQLLLNDQNLRNLGQAAKTDHLSVFHWIIDRKPLGRGQYDWIYEANDFVPLSKIDRFETTILSSFLKVCSCIDCLENMLSSFRHYSERTTAKKIPSSITTPSRVSLQLPNCSTSCSPLVS